MNNDFDFDLDDLLAEVEGDDSDGFESLDLDTIKSFLPTYKIQKICEMVVCSRYLGFGDEITVACMEELAKRREAGDPFLFEDYIEAELKKLPQLSNGVPDLREVLSQAVKGNKTR